MHRHFEVTEFQANITSSRVLITVVVGKATVDASKLDPQVMARAVPLSVIEIQRTSPIAGVPVRPDVNDVIAVERAVIE